MKFSITQSDALSAIQHVIGSTEKRDYMQILSYVKIEVKNGKARFIATNLDMQSSDYADVTGDVNTSFTVHVNTLLEVVKKIPDKSDISFFVENESESLSKLRIQSGKFKFEISTLPAKDFPVMSETDFANEINMKKEEILSLLKTTQFSMSNDEVRYNLNGVLFHTKEDGYLYCVSTDGHRLSARRLKLASDNIKLPHSIIPKKAVFEIIKLLSSYNGQDVLLKFSDKKVSFQIGKINFVTKLIDGTFPDYERVVPFTNEKTLKVEVRKLIDSVERVSIVNMKSENKSMTFTIHENQLTISSSIDSDSASEDFPVEYSDSEKFEVKYNFKYILDALNHVEDEKCIFKISNQESPVLLFGEKFESDKDSYFVVMPMRS